MTGSIKRDLAVEQKMEAVDEIDHRYWSDASKKSGGEWEEEDDPLPVRGGRG